MPNLHFALLGFVAGTIALQWQAELGSASLWLAAGAGLALAALVTAMLARSVNSSRSVPSRVILRASATRVIVAALVCASTFAFAFAYATVRADMRLAQALPEDWENVDIDIVGVVDELPARSARGTRFAFAVERVLTPQAVVPPRISLGWFSGMRRDETDEPPVVRAGERWRLTVRLKRPHGTVNPHGFDLEAWLLQNELRATGYVRPNSDHARVDGFAGRLTDYVQRARENIRDRALTALGDAPYAGVIIALAIGDQRSIPEAQWLVFNRTGITHLISISGLHVTVFAALAAALAFPLARRWPALTTRIPARRIAAAVGVLAAFGYVLLAGAQVPAQRTFLMLGVAAAGLWLGRPGTARVVWLWALVAVLALDPWAALTPGFWLSFGAVGLLLYAGTGRLHSRPRTRVAAWCRSMRAAAHAQFVVTVGLVPATLMMFQQVSLVAPLANAVAIPVVTFAVVPLALAAIALPFQLPWQAAHAMFALLMLPLDGLAALPGRTWEQHAPLTWTIIAGMLGVLWVLAPRGVPLRVLGLLWLVPLFTERAPPVPEGAVRMVVLDVGQGLAAVLQTRHHALVYDTGPRFHEDADAGGRIVAPYLRAAGVSRLDALVVSHLDLDHSGGTASVLHTVPVARVLTSIAATHPMFGTARAPPTPCVAGQTWEWDGVRFTVLHPPREWYRADAADTAAAAGTRIRVRTNDLSCVLRVDAARTLLLTGDIEARSEAALLARGALGTADVVVVPHHGSRTSSTPGFVRALAPGLAIFTVGYRNRFGHPRPDVVLRYLDRGAALARTDMDGAITVDIGSDGELRSTAERDLQRRYWYDLPRTEPPESGTDAAQSGAEPAEHGIRSRERGTEPRR